MNDHQASEYILCEYLGRGETHHVKSPTKILWKKQRKHWYGVGHGPTTDIMGNNIAGTTFLVHMDDVRHEQQRGDLALFRPLEGEDFDPSHEGKVAKSEHTQTVQNMKVQINYLQDDLTKAVQDLQEVRNEQMKTAESLETALGENQRLVKANEKLAESNDRLKEAVQQVKDEIKKVNKENAKLSKANEEG